MQRESRSSNPTDEQLRAGQAIYSRPILALYDWMVLGVSNRFLWKCPTWRLRDLYRGHLSSNHLEVGVGTGYFLDRCPFPGPTPRLVLLDLNANCLEMTARRVCRYHPQTIRANLLEPLPLPGESFDSAGINYVLHCVPGSLQSKAVVFDHLAAVLKPGGVLFGSTLLSRGVQRSFAARQLMRLYNARGFFGNAEDSLDDLRGILTEKFAQATLTAVGCAGVFVARK
jgi:ubiquinone/menaquinone biosynthesis C-methylase UbiE